MTQINQNCKNENEYNELTRILKNYNNNTNPFGYNGINLKKIFIQYLNKVKNVLYASCNENTQF